MRGRSAAQLSLEQVEDQPPYLLGRLLVVRGAAFRETEAVVGTGPDVEAVIDVVGIELFAQIGDDVVFDVLVGLDDVGSANLRRTDRVNAQQGTTRVERARNWVAGMRHAASAFGLETQLTLTEVEGVGHSFTSFCEHGRLIERIDELIFGPKTKDLLDSQHNGDDDVVSLNG